MVEPEDMGALMFGIPLLPWRVDRLVGRPAFRERRLVRACRGGQSCSICRQPGTEATTRSPASRGATHYPSVDSCSTPMA